MKWVLIWRQAVMVSQPPRNANRIFCHPVSITPFQHWKPGLMNCLVPAPAEKDKGADKGSDGPEVEEKRAMGDTMKHYRRKWVSLGGPVPGPNNNLTLLHSSPLLGDSSDCVMADDAAAKVRRWPW